MRRTLLVLAGALALGGAVADGDQWDGSSWVYTLETHTSVAPASAESAVLGIDKYWSSASASGILHFGPYGMVIVIR
ncbi:MAG: hypothetical protein IJI35_01875 [Kiritimatiellae bacterium]|nr:hypothetical protein [Kiritimatiellia bacterium]